MLECRTSSVLWNLIEENISKVWAQKKKQTYQDGFVRATRHIGFTRE